MTDPDFKDDIALSATVILVRETSHLETLMVQRSATMGFAAGALVFPGGKVDDADIQEGENPLVGPLSSVETTDLSVQRITCFAAIRELFEETGVLLATRGGILHSPADLGLTEDALRQARLEVHGNAYQFRDFLETHGLDPAYDHLTLFARWRTPPALHRRFDTWFYVAKMPEGQMVYPDGDESTEAVWGSAQEFLEMGKAGLRKIIFPTARNLELLALADRYTDTIRQTSERHIACVEPRVIERDGEKFLTIPDDLGYPVTEEKLETALRS